MIYHYAEDTYLRPRIPAQKIASKEMTVDEFDDPTTKLNYQIAEMIADTFGRSVEYFDIELADQIIAKVGMPFTRDELIQIQNGLVTLEDDYGNTGVVGLRERFDAEIERTGETS